MVRERAGRKTFYDAFVVPAETLSPGFDPRTLFPAPRPLEVDVGCGRGRFLLARAARNPGTDFIGIDRILLRLRKLDRRAVDAGLANIRVIRGDARHLVCEVFAPGTVSVFYVYFPDPWPKRRHHVNRLVAPPFVDGVHAALAAGGTIHLCTDHADYFAVMARLWLQDPRFEEVPPYVPPPDEETDFGMLFGGQDRAVQRCSFRKKAAALAEA